MMEYAHRVLKADTVKAIEAMSACAHAIADRWALGWPGRIRSLEARGQLLDVLKAQAEAEEHMYAQSQKGGLWAHLARHEVMQMYEIDPAPPKV